jgi:hypothetical protein
MTLYKLPVAIQTHTIRSSGRMIYYPLVIGLMNQSVQNRINRAIINTVNQLQQEQQKVQTGTDMEMTGHYEIKTNERGLLSLILSNYAYSHPMAHGFTTAKSLTFDVTTGKLYSLQDLFKPGSSYAVLLAGRAAEQIKQRDLPLLGGAPTVKPDQDYYLADKALVIYYPLYEITPYYVGFPMFPISVYELLPLAAPQGPLTIVAADIA